MKKVIIFILSVISVFSLLCLIGCSTETVESSPSGPSGEKVEISFDLNFITTEKAPQSITGTTGMQYGTLPTVSAINQGYSFAGWNTHKEGYGEDITASSIIRKSIGNHTLYAKWVGQKYQVSFDLNGGNIGGQTSIDSAEVVYGQSYGLKTIPNNPSKDLCVFKGWYLNAEGTGDPVTFNTKVDLSENHTLYAKYKRLRQYYDFSDSQQMEDFYFVIEEPEKLYAEFIDSSDCIKITNKTEDPTALYVLRGDFKAGTKIDFDVQFDGVYGSIHDQNSVKVGFFTYGANSNGTAIQQGPLGVPGTEGVSDDINRWYWGQGARNDSWEASVFNNGHIRMTMNVLEDCCGISMKFEFGRQKDGEGYVVDKSLWENNTWSINSIKIHYAGVGAEDDPTIMHKLSFDLNGGNVDGQTSLDSKDVNSSMKYSAVLSANPVKDGKIFIGWFFNADGTGKAINPDGEITITEDATLYAIYKDELSYFDFSDEGQIGYISNSQNAKYEITDNYLKVSKEENTEEKTFINIKTKTLVKDTKVIIKGQFVGTQGGNLGNDGLVFYGMNEDGSSIASGALGTPGEPGVPQIVTNWYWGQAVGSASWENSTWNNGDFTLYAYVLEEAYGIRLLLRFGPDQETAYYKITSIEILDGVTSYDFDDTTVKDIINIENAVTEIVDGDGDNYLKLTQSNCDNPVWIAVNTGYLKKGTTVSFEIEFFGTDGGNKDTDGIAFYCGNVGLTRMDATVKVINSASWQNQEWNGGNVVCNFTVTQDSACLILRFKFGEEPSTSYYKIKSITVNEPKE